MYQYNFQFRKPYCLQFSMNFNRNTNTATVNIGKVLSEKFSKWVCYIYILHWYHSESLDEESFSTKGSLLEDARPEIRSRGQNCYSDAKKEQEAREPYRSPEIK